MSPRKDSLGFALGPGGATTSEEVINGRLADFLAERLPAGVAADPEQRVHNRKVDIVVEKSGAHKIYLEAKLTTLAKAKEHAQQRFPCRPPPSARPMSARFATPPPSTSPAPPKTASRWNSPCWTGTAANGPRRGSSPPPNSPPSSPNPSSSATPKTKSETPSGPSRTPWENSPKK